MFVERSFLRAKRAELEGRVGYGTRMVNIAGERACVADDCCGNERAGRLVVFALKGRCRALKAFDAPIHIAHRDIGSIKLSVTERGFHCALTLELRSEERSGGKEGVRECRTGGAP